MRLYLVFFTLFISTFLFATSATAKEQQLDAHDGSSCAIDGVALGGHDVVAYHTLNTAVLGNTEIVATHNDLTYFFNSKQHKELFESDPIKYLPHFQGWCAIALARNRLTCPDYENFKIEDGKLLLFETITFFNGRNVWNSDPIKNLISAQKNFDRLLEK